MDLTPADSHGVVGGDAHQADFVGLPIGHPDDFHAAGFAIGFLLMDEVADRNQPADTVHDVLEDFLAGTALGEADDRPALAGLGVDGGGLHDADLVGGVVVEEQRRAAVEPV